MYNNIRRMVTNPKIDPPPRHCFNCWKKGHSHTTCPREQKKLYCKNCGRRHVDVSNCPRCGEAHREHLAYLHRLRQERQERYEREQRKEAEVELRGRAGLAAQQGMLRTREQEAWAQPRRRDSQTQEGSHREDAYSGRSSSRHEEAREGRERHSRKRTRESSSSTRGHSPKRRSREPSLDSRVSHRPATSNTGTRHETLRILEETHRMADEVREDLMRVIVREFMEEHAKHSRR